MMNKLGANNFAWEDGLTLKNDLRSEYTFNSTIEGIEEADAVLLVGTNPRMEAPLINTRLRKCAIQNDLEVAAVGPAMDLTYGYEDLGNDAKALSAIASGSHPYSKTLKEAENPLVIIGLGALKDPSMYAMIEKMKQTYPNLESEEGWYGINILQLGAGRTAALDIGFSSAAKGPVKFAYLLNAEPEEKSCESITKDTFVVYQGHHGDKGAMMADVILPGAAYTEKSSSYVNTEGRPQMTRTAVDMPQQAREDWKIIRALSECLGVTLPYNSLAEVQARLTDVCPTFANYGVVEPTSYTTSAPDETSGAISKFEPAVQNFYMTNPIGRSSSIMAQCSRQLPKSTSSYL
eukprot:1319008-Amorphochlora_amoeboformis.AAC.1